MPRIAGVNIPENKQIETALTYIYGIGRPLSSKILKESGVPSTKRANDLTDKEVAAIRQVLEGKFKIEGDLRREIMANIKRMKEIRCWRGLRHIKGLPVRGQKTKKNSRTIRGNVKKTVGSGRKAAPAPK
ncbi:MAG: 30S ribosomal protein S13 [Candidatus Pacebacteria bacterium]|nr:30S ribosomal protein S13 [Candidatus Paceibacterota bacterium]